jgi:AcrR family transcriptional regulator
MNADRPKPPSNEPSSPERILTAAENLFSDKGFSAVSLRKVTSEAGVNLAAVNYHFGSKDGLIEAVLRRNIEPINLERLRLLEQFEMEAGGSAPPEKIIEAFIRPGIEGNLTASGRGRRLLQLYGRIHTEPDSNIHDLFVQMFSTVTQRFGAALHRALPHLSVEEIAWRMHFVIGVVAQSCQAPDRVRYLSHGAINPDAENTIEQMIPFLVAGLLAPGGAGKTNDTRGRQ